MLRKLYEYGIRGLPLDWFRSYLTDRRQSVRIVDSFSAPEHTSCGVPQGSIIGPVLFLLYVNELPMLSDSRCTLFADDTTLTRSNYNYNALVNDANAYLHKIIDFA